jgi:hypothetical protein
VLFGKHSHTLRVNLQAKAGEPALRKDVPSSKIQELILMLDIDPHVAYVARGLVRNEGEKQQGPAQLLIPEHFG